MGYTRQTCNKVQIELNSHGNINRYKQGIVVNSFFIVAATIAFSALYRNYQQYREYIELEWQQRKKQQTRMKIS